MTSDDLRIFACTFVLMLPLLTLWAKVVAHYISSDNFRFIIYLAGALLLTVTGVCVTLVLT